MRKLTTIPLYGDRTEARDQVRVQAQSLLGRGRHTRQGAPVVAGAAHREALGQSELSIVATWPIRDEYRGHVTNHS